ncbi:hypothetical protein CWE17_11230 [Synechococcus sp. BS56D]|nr:hypothetical protein CWE17_11230 [Synechococcus sp. BS56D]
MVLLDTGSPVKIVALAEAAGARVERMDWPGDFAPARNAALEYVKGDWVLVLDTDERLREEAIPALRSLMVQPDVLVINLLRHELGTECISCISERIRACIGRVMVEASEGAALVAECTPHGRTMVAQAQKALGDVESP